MQLQKRAARDPSLQKKIIIEKINKGAYQSRLFRHLLMYRKNHLSEAELEKKHIKELFCLYKPEE